MDNRIIIENLILFFIGSVPFFIAVTVLVWWRMGVWLQDYCAIQGPDFVRRHYFDRLLVLASFMFALVLLFWGADWFYLSKKNLLGDALSNRIPVLKDWGGEGVVAHYVWFGSLIGVFLGLFVGTVWTFHGNLKCRRIFPFLTS